MSVFKCKMCGGTLEFNQGETVGVCDHCGTKQTLPKLDDEKRVQLYDRANHFRRENEFDKAMGIYEMILAEDKEDSEAYWGIVLCKYGIEYVEDPRSHKRIPTVNRAQYTSVFDDKDYLSAIQHADGYQRDIYEEEARAIDAIQKGILEISAKEEPFDVFICYKETDELGNRTQDSVYAQELYNALKKEGYKVFFARITLENKLGQQYEPFIFAALHSAKVMLVVGTSKENFNAVWVKNEWSRFLALSKEDSSKVIIPCYKDISPYDMPEEFTYLQSQDMGKIGYIQDVIHGIEKFVKKETVKETVVVSGGNANTAPLLKRAFMFLEDGDWQSADEYCEKVLDIDPENGEAYLGKLMAEQKVHKQEQLADCAQPFDGSSNYQKAIRFGDSKLKTSLEGFVKHIVDRNENDRLAEQYTAALNKMQTATDENTYHIAASAFRTISGFKDADELYSQCVEKAETCRKNAVYDSAKAQMIGGSVSDYEAAMNTFRTISGWKNADEKIALCQNRIEEIKAKEEEDRLEAEEKRIAKEKAAKKRKKIIAITTPIVVACIAFVIVLTTVIIPNSKYSAAVAEIEKGNIVEGYEALIALNGYKDSAEKAETVRTQYVSEKLKAAKVGDYVVFGSYEQDNNTSNGKEDVEWLVLAREGDKALVISRYALDRLPYNNTYTSVTWETCSLRKWLNGTFIDNAFSDDEKKMLQSTKVTADKNPDYSTSPGSDTNDKVFLLSINEVNKYFDSDAARQCKPTAYAVAHETYTTYDNDNCCYWWLRSPDDNSRYAAYVGRDGSVNTSVGLVFYDDYAVRPALWISLE